MSLINPKIFKAYDVRGVVGEDLDADGMARIGRAWGTFMKTRGADRAVVGRDVRPSSEEMTDRFVEGLASTGVDVEMIGVATSPQLYFALKDRGAGGGAMVTASHNPSQYNGLKLRCGGPVYGDQLQELRALTEAGEFASGSGDTTNVEGNLERYLAAAAAHLKIHRPLQVVLDGGNGTAGPAAAQLFERLGCKVHPLYCDPDGTFPNHHPNPLLAENLEDLRLEVRSRRADLGVAFDGDGDRLTLVDEGGVIRWSDLSLAVLARRLLPENKGRAVVFDVKASQTVVDVVREEGGRPVMVKTGYPFLLDAMDRENALMGAELSGHMYFDDEVFDFDDGVYAAARLAQALSEEDQPVSEAYEALPRYVTSGELRVPCEDERKHQIAEELAERFSRDHAVVTLDGARVSFEDGWGLVRASNTEPDLVLVFEGRDEKALDRIRETFRRALADFSEVDADRL